MPSEVYLMWQQYPWTFGDLACDAKIVVTEAIIYASILTIVAFSCERWLFKLWIFRIICFVFRYLAICQPLSPLARSSTGQAKKMIGLIWSISFMSASPWAFFTKVNYLTYGGEILKESAWCSIPFNEETSGSLYMMFGSTIIYFFAPMIVVTLLYTRYEVHYLPPFNFHFPRIGLTLHRNKMRRCVASSNGGDCAAERQVFHFYNLTFFASFW